MTPPFSPIHILTQRLSRAIDARPGELLPALGGFALFFCLFAGYFMLRPIREAMGIAGGVNNLQWLFTATFVVMLIAVPPVSYTHLTLPTKRIV